jgi:hypothetical protein
VSAKVERYLEKAKECERMGKVYRTSAAISVRIGNKARCGHRTKSLDPLP